MRTTGVILAGGASRRMGGQDKGLILFRGRPMVAWVVEALAPQVDELLIVANRNLESYRAFGHPVVSDLRPDFPGPLAGIEAALTALSGDEILCCPTDAPLLPPEYAARMSGSSPAVASWGAYWQPVFCRLPRTLLTGLRHSLDAGERSATRWLASLSPRVVLLDDLAARMQDADDPEALKALDRATD